MSKPWSPTPAWPAVAAVIAALTWASTMRLVPGALLAALPRMDLLSFAPTSARLRIVKSRLSEGSWHKRVAGAIRAEWVLLRIVGLRATGLSQNQAISHVLAKAQRSWGIHRLTRYAKHGIEGLFDMRLPRLKRDSGSTRQIVEETCRDCPDASSTEVLDALEGKQGGPLPSMPALKREVARARAGRRAEEKQQAAPESAAIDLVFGGGELLLAAETETGAIAALTHEIRTIAEEALEASKGLEPRRDLRYRDEKGKFTPTYNQVRKRKEGEVIASYLRSSEEKGEGRVPSWPRFVHERAATIDAKLRTLVFDPMVSRIHGWDGLRAAEAAGLAPLTGLAYMPSTLSKFTSALAVSGAGPRLLERSALHWNAVATAHWGEEGGMEALYVDNHVNESWTSFYAMSNKVARLNRVMPAVTTSFAHTGAGTPVVLAVQSGSAPLAPGLLRRVERAEKILGDEIRRAVVIDSEGSVFDVLESFKKAERVIVTPLRPSRAPELDLAFSRGSYFRPYRDNDELRVARATLHHKSTGRSLELGALLVRRSHRASDTVLLTTGLELDWEGRDLADLYFSRWPLQENWFRAGAAVKLDKHRGHSARMVANVAIVTEMEQLRARREKTQKRLATVEAGLEARTAAADEARRVDTEAQGRLETCRSRVESAIAKGRIHTNEFTTAAVEHHQALKAAEIAQADQVRAQTQLDGVLLRKQRLEDDLTKAGNRLAAVEPLQQIRQLDTALDMILTATKLTGLQLISFAVREYMPTHRMTAQTFIARLLAWPGRREPGLDVERIIFKHNPRDPEMASALREACEVLNQRGLSRDGRKLQYQVEEPAS